MKLKMDWFSYFLQELPQECQFWKLLPDYNENDLSYFLRLCKTAWSMQVVISGFFLLFCFLIVCSLSSYL